MKNGCFVGVPDHQGVFNIGGRLGSVHGPEAFRRLFKKLSGVHPVLEHCSDEGDIGPITTDIQLNHRLAIEGLSELMRKYSWTIVVGGGHDHGYTQLKALQSTLGPKKNIGCINVDAHFDLRPSEPALTSGCPFRLALEQGILTPKHLVEFGIQEHCNTRTLWQYAAEHKIKTIPFQQLRGGKAVNQFRKQLKMLTRQCDSVVVSLDLDAVCASDAPGVSAPQSEGFTASEIIEMSEIAGTFSNVVSFGIFELSPPHDEGEKTARLAATAAHHFAAHALSI